jgi:hypothetical protein
MKIIPEIRHAHYIWYLRLYYYEVKVVNVVSMVVT